MRIRAAVLFLLAVACGKSDEQKAAEAAIQQLQALGKAMGDQAATAGAGAAAATAMMAGKASEAVDFRVLKDLMPEEINGMPRSNHEGEKNSAMGFTVSRAEARYETQGSNASIKVEISDIGAMTGMAAMAAFAWASVEMDQESDNGYEKTMTLKGYRGYERVDRQSNFAELSVLVGGRFVVDLEGNEVPMDVLKSVLDKIDLGKLEGMKNFGVK